MTDAVPNSDHSMSHLLPHPVDLEITWNYGEAHYFKGPHDGIGGAVKCKAFSNEKATKEVIQNAHHFAEYANQVGNFNALYLDKSDVQYPDANDSIYIHRKVHQVKKTMRILLNFTTILSTKIPQVLRKINYEHENGNIDFYEDISVNDEKGSVTNEKEHIPQVGDVVKYETKCKVLSYMVIQSIMKMNNILYDT